MSKARLFRTILCPVDLSAPSRRALSYAALLASQAKRRLIVLYAEDPLLVTAAAMEFDETAYLDNVRKQLKNFVAPIAGRYGLPSTSIVTEVAVGQPHAVIESTSGRQECDLVVMGTHGATGAQKFMLGSTTHRILRSLALPVLAVPPVKKGLQRPPRGWPGRRVLAPIDLSASDRVDAVAAAVVARELGSAIELMHVVEPLSMPEWIDVDATKGNLQRQRRAMAHLTSLRDEVSWAASECRVETGKPADKIAAVASAPSVGLVILTRRRGQGLFGPKQGAISYEVLRKAMTPVLALPGDRRWQRRVLTLRPK